MDALSTPGATEPVKVDVVSEQQTNKSLVSSAQPTKFRMIALDLDGTLLHSNHKISEKSVEYLRDLQARGMLVLLATGRAPCTMYEHVLHLNLPYEHGMPVVTSNGALGLYVKPVAANSDCEVSPVYNPKDVSEGVTIQELFYEPVPHDVTMRSIALANRLGHVCQFYWENDIYANPSAKHQYELTQAYKDLTGSQTIYVNDDFAELMSSSSSSGPVLPSKFLVMCDKSDQDDMVDAFNEEFGDEATIVRGSYGWFLEVLHKDVCKGNGLQRLCQHVDIPIEQCIAFGDGDNDLEFIEMAGWGVAMKNARDCIMKVSDEVAAYTNNEDGVIRTLQRMEEEGLLDVTC
mmetsp:Transcript_30569/g.46911  ORF Transcript_30569/g.46911 Transcript_30569/m.46911 type:complete len:347 (+) Transcript_30569:150-1190(+)|eukprot:CAMPEP_0195300530 /NCGR_PEP_ID=MMETSP0707-20130614/27619_1 /TAXON_ID=33640 /ORGANISM="Asterionellopsis glacialis, Strain CCMP134" /LENGTH=346 /DNA_ID=CAMNT_0040363249 /DNA_START=90 /DNA_END=1130 /DNA_ORIENTATION=+